MNSRGRRAQQAGFTLFEILISMVLLAMVAAMIYSVLNVGIKFTDQGGKKILAMERRYGLLNLIQRQVTSAVYDPLKKRLLLSAGDEQFSLVTRNPFIYPEAGVVLAIYRYNAGERAIYYTEKRDYYNTDYALSSPADAAQAGYQPDFGEMTVLAEDEDPLVVEYDEEAGPEVTVSYRGEAYTMAPKCADAAALLKLNEGKK